MMRVGGFYIQFFRPFCLCFLVILFFFNTSIVFSNEYVPERRKDQFPKVPAYLLVPLPYSYPGVGEGFFLMGSFSNLYDTTTDFLAMYIVGDAGGEMFLLDEMPIIDERLYLNLSYQNIDRALINNYKKRGMRGTSKNDYTLLDIGLSLDKSALVDLTFFDRRLDFFFSYTENEFELQAIRESNGDLVTELDYRGKSFVQKLGVSIDLTDDYLDPKKGFRFVLTYQDVPSKQDQEPNYYTLDYNALLYLPMFKSDTLVFNYYQSDAHVRTKGDSNLTNIRDEIGMNCDVADTACLQTEQELVDIFVNQRTHGTASSLGGNDRLRSYPQGRFNGGHSAFLGAEYRFNFKQEVTPFNYLLWKDVRTGVQLAFFAEMASVSETSGKIWNDIRYSYGTGARLVAGSGSVYRADVAFGDEGASFIVFFYYPWES